MKVLIVRFSSIGDIVLTTPVIRAARQLGAEVHYLTKRPFRSIVEANPGVDKVFAIDKKVREVRAGLQREGYDYVLDLHNNLRSLQVKWALPAKSYTFDKINLEKWLMVNLRINRLPAKHIVERYMAPAERLGAAYDGQGLDYFIPEKDEVAVGTLLGTGINTPDFIAFAIGAAHNTKRLPTDQIITLCEQLPLPVVLLGGPGEAEEGNTIAAAVRRQKVVNTCGQLNLHQSASVVRQASKVITHDTGMMHIAAAFQKEILSLWGNTIPAFGMYPFYPQGVQKNQSFEVEGLRCRPCSKIGFQECPKGHFKCMRELPLEKIAAAAKLE